jgi:hypothetical protein
MSTGRRWGIGVLGRLTYLTPELVYYLPLAII